MPALTFNTCCGCIELRTGCLIIGYVNLIADIILIIFGILGLAAVVTLANDPKYHEAGGFVIAVVAITLIVTILLLGFIIALLVGIHKNKRGHVKAFLIFAVIFIIFNVLSFFTMLGGTISAAVIVKQLIQIILSIYFLLVIRSYYYKMDKAAPSCNTA